MISVYLLLDCNLPETSSIPTHVWLAGTSALDDWTRWGIYALWSYLIVLASRSSHEKYVLINTGQLQPNQGRCQADSQG